MAKKHAHSHEHDTFLITLAAAVVIMGAMVIMGMGSGWFGGSRPSVEGVNTEYSPAQLMKQLQGTVDDGGEGELNQLENESSGL